MKPLLLGLVIYFSQLCHGQLKDCYYMDGRAASTDFPCDPDAEVSACCGLDWTCVSSLYCQPRAGDGSIGSCTDRSFKDNACPFPLTEKAGLYRNDHNTVAQSFTLGNNATICPDKTVCPNLNNETCCNSGAGKKEIIFHYANPIPSEIKDLSSFYALVGYSIPSSTTSSSSPVVFTSPTSTESSVDKRSASVASASRTTSLPSKPSNLPGTPTADSASSGLTSAAKAGMGVGIGLGTALLVCVAIIFLRRHRNRTLARDPLALPPLPPQAGHWPVTAERMHFNAVPVEMSGERAPAELERITGDRYEM